MQLILIMREEFDLMLRNLSILISLIFVTGLLGAFFCFVFLS
jgi:hypothetical protein